jgi:hypothetical protein
MKNSAKLSDPLGKAISEYWENPQGKYSSVEVFMNGEPMQEMHATLFFRNSRQFKQYERLALKECVGPVLDVGAASGIHSIWLHSRGLEVTSLDFSELCCKVMLQRGLTEVVCDDVMLYDPKKKFKTILLLMNGTGLAGSLDNLVPFLKKLKKMLQKDGQILIDSSDIMYYYRGRAMPLHCYYGDVEFQMRYGKMHGSPFPWTFVDPDTLLRYAEQAGYTTEFLHTDSGGHYLAKLRVR